MFDFLAVPMNALLTAITSATGVTAAVAIILTTVAVRILLLPLGFAQHRADQRRTIVLTRAAEIQREHAADPQRLQAEMTAFYQAEGGGLALGCLPVILQVPVFLGLYQLFVSPSAGGALLGQTLFGVPLGSHIVSVGAAQLPVFAVLLAFLAVIGFASTRLLRPPTPPTGAARVVYNVVPYLAAIFALFMPLAATLYLATTAAWTLAQTVLLRHFFR